MTSLHLIQFSAILRVLARGNSVHSLMFSSHRFFWLPPLPPDVLHDVFLASSDDLVMCLSFSLVHSSHSGLKLADSSLSESTPSRHPQLRLETYFISTSIIYIFHSFVCHFTLISRHLFLCFFRKMPFIEQLKVRCEIHCSWHQ